MSVFNFRWENPANPGQIIGKGVPYQMPVPNDEPDVTHLPESDLSWTQYQEQIDRNNARIAELEKELAGLGYTDDDALDRRLAANRARMGDYGTAQSHLQAVQNRALNVASKVADQKKQADALNAKLQQNLISQAYTVGQNPQAVKVLKAEEQALRDQITALGGTPAYDSVNNTGGSGVGNQGGNNADNNDPLTPKYRDAESAITALNQLLVNGVPKDEDGLKAMEDTLGTFEDDVKASELGENNDIKNEVTKWRTKIADQRKANAAAAQVREMRDKAATVAKGIGAKDADGEKAKYDMATRTMRASIRANWNDKVQGAYDKATKANKSLKNHLTVKESDGFKYLEVK